jgi:hypothetical protein
MLGNQAPSTPRPVAPGRAKRMATTPGVAATLSKASPPPPYTQQEYLARSRVDSLLGSPVAITSQMLEYFSGPQPSSPRASIVAPSGPEDWMEEKSREELRELLVRADQTIKERESGKRVW